MRSAPDSIATPILLAELSARLPRNTQAPLALLIVRLPALERTAWREGLRKARALERRACSAFASAALHVLRAEDTIAHDPGSDIFLAALTAPTRGGAAPIPIDPRSALARISACMGSATQLDIEAGWTMFDIGELSDAIVRGLARGAQERERYAFFSAIGHELRTPLASIRGYLETVLDEGIDAPMQRRFLSIAHKESLRLSRLIDGMFEISLLDLAPSSIARTSCVLNDALEATADACSSAAATHAMTLVCQRVSDVRVDMDPDRLMLVLINVVDNAIKHGRRGGRVAIGADLADTTFACVLVDDNGPGVNIADRERIFTLGTRGPTDAPGSGIGLALVRLMLERIGGRVDVVDSPLGGARIRLFLPRPRVPVPAAMTASVPYSTVSAV